MTKPIVNVYWLKINRRHQAQQAKQAALENGLSQSQPKTSSMGHRLTSIFGKRPSSNSSNRQKSDENN